MSREYDYSGDADDVTAVGWEAPPWLPDFDREAQDQFNGDFDAWYASVTSGTTDDGCEWQSYRYDGPDA